MKRRIKIAIAVTSLAMLGTAGFIYIPRSIRKQISPNESAIIAILKNLTSSQAQLQASGAIDSNGDGTGEYGFLGEMTGERTLRGSRARLESPVLKASVFTYVGKGIYRTRGYYLRIFLPGVDEVPRWERDPDDTRLPVPVDADIAATVWWCLAWPVSHRRTGNRCFFVNQRGDVLSSNNLPARYSGLMRIPPPNAATPPSLPPSPPWEGAVNDYGANRARWSVQ